ncbi:MAG: ribonuclease HII [Saprospiraceae bacterium]|nr:ribonuclease HII [Saprospiraceae bacterium]
MAAFYHPDWLEAGCDEAGRGCLAGPVFAAACILAKDFYHPWLNDSKQLTAHQRNVLRAVIEREALAWAVGRVEAAEIDAINILRASFLAMHRALDQLVLRPEFILVDGNRFDKYGKIAHACVVQGDGKFAAIAAASVLAKTHRDAEMLRLQADFPYYQWHSNQGYPTLAHRQAIREHGISPHHRRSFQLLPVQEELLFF